MKYEESKPSGYRNRMELDIPEGVHIRQENRGVMMYAVFDGEEQVSQEFGPLNDQDCIAFVEGYAKAKSKFWEE